VFLDRVLPSDKVLVVKGVEDELAEWCDREKDEGRVQYFGTKKR
jgi:hypothetical protein